VGFTYARVGISRGLEGPWKPVRLLVDTGAAYTMLPRRVLTALGVRPRWRKTFRLADGRTMEREMGVLHVRYRRSVAPTLVVFGEPKDAALLSVLSLEELGFLVDPKSRRLREIKIHPMVPLAAA
jgi:predicted aspartyl protease